MGWAAERSGQILGKGDVRVRFYRDLNHVPLLGRKARSDHIRHEQALRVEVPIDPLDDLTEPWIDRGLIPGLRETVTRRSFTHRGRPPFAGA